MPAGGGGGGEAGLLQGEAAAPVPGPSAAHLRAMLRPARRPSPPVPGRARRGRLPTRVVLPPSCP